MGDLRIRRDLPKVVCILQGGGWAQAGEGGKFILGPFMVALTVD